MFRFTALLFAGLFFLFGCQKDPNIPTRTTYEIVLGNDYNLLQGQYAAFLTNSAGEIKAFRWLNGSDTTQLTIPFSTEDVYDCTLAKITVLETAAGRDTSVELVSYKQIANHSEMNIRNLNYQKTIDYRIQFKNITSLDTIIVPNGLTFVKPQASNNFFGHFKIQHTGDFWFRVRINGDPHWRYMIYNNFNGTELTDEIDPNILPKMADDPPIIDLPFLATWKYSLEGVLNLESSRLIPIGDLDRAPGGSVPVLNQLTVFKPDNQSFLGYRVNLKGYNSQEGGYTFYYDRIFETVPTFIQKPNFDVSPSTLNDGRLIAVNCVGDFDDLVITRKNNTTPHISWAVITETGGNGSTVKYRLPDVPAALSAKFPSLGNYSFGAQTLVRAENYAFLDGIDAVYSKIFKANDPFWQAKAQMMGIERQF
jgi:hypothetical protein